MEGLHVYTSLTRAANDLVISVRWINPSPLSTERTVLKQPIALDLTFLHNHVLRSISTIFLKEDMPNPWLVTLENADAGVWTMKAMILDPLMELMAVSATVPPRVG